MGAGGRLGGRTQEQSETARESRVWRAVYFLKVDLPNGYLANTLWAGCEAVEESDQGWASHFRQNPRFSESSSDLVQSPALGKGFHVFADVQECRLCPPTRSLAGL